MDTILVVDDEQSVRKLMKSFLVAAGYSCLLAESVADAKRMLAQHPVDLVLSDINMPGESGFDLIRHMHSTHPGTAVVMVSVIDNPREASEALELGAYGYIVKPFTRNIVLINVENALRRRHLEMECKRTVDTLEDQVRQRTESLHNQLTFLQTLIDAIPSPIFYKDTAGVFQGCNAAFEEFAGKDRSDLVGHTAADLIPQLLADISFDTDRQLLAEPGQLTYEYDIAFPDGTTRNFLVNKAAYPDVHGRTAGLAGVMVDITAKTAMERELRQSQKLEAIGQLAAGIAHEINTPIQYVGDNTRFLQEAFDDLSAIVARYTAFLETIASTAAVAEPIRQFQALTAETDLAYLVEEIPQALAQTLEGVERVSKIVRAMRHFSHPGTDKKVATDLNEALESTITVARNEWKYVAELRTDLAADLPLVPCFPGEMNQVFLNLIINAAHAVSEATDGGRRGRGIIAIATRRRHGTASIEISDTGPGIPEAIQSRIFDPFFTTKAVGKGTGQGLAIARAVVVDKHHGSLRFDTAPGRGTTFTIDLPIGGDDDTGEADDV